MAGLTACGGAGGPTDKDADWRTADGLLDRTRFIWAVGDEVHLGDGSTIDVGEPVDEFVVAGDGVFYVPTGADDSELWFVREGGEPEPTGVHAAEDRLVVSQDGRFLVELVAPDRYSRDPELRIFDLAQGTETTTSDHLDLGSEDREQAWEEIEFRLAGADDEEVFLEGEGTWAFDLASGDSREVGDDETVPGTADLVTSPSGTWRLDWDQASPTRVRSLADDTRVAVRHRGSPVLLTGWIDDDTVHGVPLAGSDDPVLVVCELSSRSCEELAGTAGAEVVVLEGMSSAIDLDATRALGEQELGAR